jgi:hypothetical protein
VECSVIECGVLIAGFGVRSASCCVLRFQCLVLSFVCGVLSAYRRVRNEECGKFSVECGETDNQLKIISLLCETDGRERVMQAGRYIGDRCR